MVAPGVPDPENVRPSLVYAQERVELATDKIVGAICVGAQLGAGSTVNVREPPMTVTAPRVAVAVSV